MKISYSHKEPKNPNRGYDGIEFSETYVSSAFKKQVKEKLLDSDHTATLVDTFKEALPTTGFDESVLVDILSLDKTIDQHDSFRVGEAFTEHVLEENYKVRFHYNELRDARNPLGNKTGADLLGFIDINSETIFVFGEVKTSSDPNSPPQVLYGETGMINQLEELATDNLKRGALVRYIATKVVLLPEAHPFRLDFKVSLKNYVVAKTKKIKLFGVLVRDTTPNELDLKARYKAILSEIEKETSLKLLALYMPFKQDKWNKKIKEK